MEDLSLVDEPVTDVVFVASLENCPKGYKAVEETPCGHSAQMWERVLGGEKGDHYLCFTKDKESEMVVEDMYIPCSSAQWLVKDFESILKTVEGKPALYHKQLAIKKVPRKTAKKIVADIFVAKRRDKVSELYKRLDKVNGLRICVRQIDYKPSSSSSSQEQQQSRDRTFSEPAPTSPTTNTAAAPPAPAKSRAASTRVRSHSPTHKMEQLTLSTSPVEESDGSSSELVPSPSHPPIEEAVVEQAAMLNSSLPPPPSHSHTHSHSPATTHHLPEPSNNTAAAQTPPTEAHETPATTLYQTQPTASTLPPSQATPTPTASSHVPSGSTWDSHQPLARERQHPGVPSGGSGAPVTSALSSGPEPFQGYPQPSRQSGYPPPVQSRSVGPAGTLTGYPPPPTAGSTVYPPPPGPAPPGPYPPPVTAGTYSSMGYPPPLQAGYQPTAPARYPGPPTNAPTAGGYPPPMWYGGGGGGGVGVAGYQPTGQPQAYGQGLGFNIAGYAPSSSTSNAAPFNPMNPAATVAGPRPHPQQRYPPYQQPPSQSYGFQY